MPRPALPFRHANPHLKQLDSGPLPPVKYQILNCQGKDILVGRMKIVTPTSSGHAFILRRFDTGAISLTTMFRAAFPAASEQEEKRETSWVKDNYNLSGLNGSSKDVNTIRLAGTWVSPEIALELATPYSLTHIMTAIAKATPDPNGNYRRSGKAATGTTPKASPTPAAPPSKTLPSPSSPILPNPAKRRKELSPVPAPAPARAISPARGTSPPPRRSTRLKSPTPKPPSVRQAVRRSPRTRVEQVVTPDGSDEAAIEIDGAEDVAVQDLHAQDVAEQQAMIADLRAKRDAVKKVGSEDESSKLKRVREEEGVLQFEFKEPEVGERAIATNRKVSAFRLEPRTKAVAWGVAAFAVGLGAVSFLPNFL